MARCARWHTLVAAAAARRRRPPAAFGSVLGRGAAYRSLRLARSSQNNSGQSAALNIKAFRTTTFTV